MRFSMRVSNASMRLSVRCMAVKTTAASATPTAKMLMSSGDMLISYQVPTPPHSGEPDLELRRVLAYMLNCELSGLDDLSDVAMSLDV